MVKKLTIGEMEEIATSRDGRCLSTAYKDNKSKLEWECREGHRWFAVPSSVKNNKRWCPICAGNIPLYIEEMHMLAKAKSGICLSQKYVSIHKKLLWECRKGHRWEATPSHVKHSNRWCPECAGNLPLTLKDMKDLATSRGGKCLSKKYINSKTKILWQCADGHQWWAKPDNIRHLNQWCPDCKKFNMEILCREIFEKLFNEKFPKIRPGWLLSDKGKPLELDGYSEKLQIAFEYNGPFHARKDQKRRDQIKKKLCHKAGVKLFVIDYRIDFKTIPEFIRKSSKDLNLDVSRIDFEQTINLSSDLFFKYSQLKELQKIAKSKKGKLISTVYRGNKIKLSWECHLEHQWDTTPGNVLKGSWCPECGGSKKLDISVFKKIAKERGGKCLSDEYVNIETNLEWECSEGHRWFATPNSVKNKPTWCYICAGNAKTPIEALQEIAKEKGGKCLSKDYQNNASKICLVCKKGHHWETAVGNLKAGNWCPTCGKSVRRFDIEVMHDEAEKHGGKCLSKKYMNTHTPLLWQCNKGHKWKAKPMIIRRGHWCKKCYHESLRKDSNV